MKVVAWLIDGVISNNLQELKRAVDLNKHFELICDKRAKFMAACDLGQNWENLAKAPVIFNLKD